MGAVWMAEKSGLDRRPHDADVEALQFGDVGHGFLDDQVAHAAAGVADQHHIRLGGDFIGDRLEGIAVEHLVPMRASRNRNGMSISGAAFENVDMCEGETRA